MAVTSIILDRTICSKIEYLYMERYRSGHNGADSKFLKSVSVLSAGNPVTMRGHAVRKTEYFVVLSVSSFQKFWERFSD